MSTEKREEPKVSGELDALWDAAIEQAIGGETGALDEYVLKYVSDKSISGATLKSLGDRLANLGALDHALKCYLRSLFLDDSQAETWFAAAIVFHHEGQLQKAIGHYQVALVKSPMHPLVHSNLASAYLDGGQAAMAKRHACTALIFDPVRI